MMKKLVHILSIFILIFLILMLYSRFVGSKGLITNEIKIEVDNLTDNFNGLKIVHFSDLHYGRTIKRNELENIVNEINSIKPDIVVFTGDLFDKDINLSLDEKEIVANLLSKINSNLGKYIISGNHDIIDEWENIITEASFININDTYNLIYNKDNTPIIISGISSNINSNLNIKDKIKPIDDFISNIENKLYSILLIHEPDYIDEINIDNFDLILAGHSHGGQVRLPFLKPPILPVGAKKYYDNYYKINNTDLFISNGLGTSTYNYRFMSKPSINFYRIIKK